ASRRARCPRSPSPRYRPRRRHSRPRHRGTQPPACPKPAALAESGPWSSLYTTRVWKEQLLAADLVVGDRLLTLSRDHPVNKGQAHLHLDVRVLGRIDEDHAVLVEQALVALDRNDQFAAVLEREPRPPIRQRIRVHAGCGIQRRAHAGARIAVPGTLVPGDVDAGGFPYFESRELGAALV